MNDKVVILDFGSQYTQLIARRIRELNVFCEIYPFNKKFELTSDIKAVILSGSPFSVNQENAPQVDLSRYLNKVPLLGVCYGAQYMAKHLGGKVEKSTKREYGKASLSLSDDNNSLLQGVDENSQVWMSHADTIIYLSKDFNAIAATDSIPIAAFEYCNSDTPAFGLQFHPEVTHSTQGKDILGNFVINIAGAKADWSPEAFIEESVREIRAKVGDEKVLLGLSGGVDSTIAASLLQKAIGDNLHCYFINNGLLRKNEFSSVLDSYMGMGLNVFGIDASDEFLSQLDGVSDPERKRKIIGKTFIDVFEREAKKNKEIKWLAQGTIYPDVIESVSVHGPSVTIKSHHNVGGLPEKLDLKLIEPLRMLFKDEVRKVGRTLNVKSEIVERHPFPGPGLAIRVLGPLTPERIRLCQEADYIYINKLKESGWYNKVWQAGAILLPIKSVGVMGDERTYENTIALRCVNSVDGMTADWSHLPYELLGEISNDIINNVKGINRVVYDISTKPPSTIEWE